jgi:hypothetical protein
MTSGLLKKYFIKSEKNYNENYIHSNNGNHSNSALFFIVTPEFMTSRMLLFHDLPAEIYLGTFRVFFI